MISFRCNDKTSTEFQENREKGAPPAEYAADILIDTSGFVAGELAGWIPALLLSETVVLALPAKWVTDVSVGVAYDIWIDSIDGRDRLTKFFQSIGNNNNTMVPEFDVTPIPPPTPEPVDQDKGFPGSESNCDTVDNSLPGTPMPSQVDSGSSDQVTPIVTQTPEPSENP